VGETGTITVSSTIFVGKRNNVDLPEEKMKKIISNWNNIMFYFETISKQSNRIIRER
jgi:hypothetical protein